MLRKYATAAGTLPAKNYSKITPPYGELLRRLPTIRDGLRRKLSYAEKILYTHLSNTEEALQEGIVRGESYLKLSPDRVAMQDASAQMALLQFSTCNRYATSVPSSIHCDHLISGRDGAERDLERAVENNKEVFSFLKSAAEKYGIEFWGPGSGIIHQIVLENYAAPGLLMLGTDSHTPNAGGLGTIAIGVGGADAVDAMTGTPWELKAPNIVGVELRGKKNPWVSPKDIILEIVGQLTVRGGTGNILEYFGEGLKDLSGTGMATICNMGAEMGATTSVFPFTEAMHKYLVSTDRKPVAEAASKASSGGLLSADDGFEYDKHIVIDLDTLEPKINGPFTPDLSHPLSKWKDAISENGWVNELSASLIGSCTNSSYEDMTRVTSLAQQALDKGLKAHGTFMITPGSEMINATIRRDGITSELEKVGGRVLANACGPCIGQWDRDEKKGEDNAILTSFNRNFRGRNDGNRKTLNFLASPEIVVAKAFSSDLSFDPTRDPLIDADGNPFYFARPHGVELPPEGFIAGDVSQRPAPDPVPQPDKELVISPSSSRLELLEPFAPHWTSSDEKKEFTGLRVLLRVRGKCTTDEISAAGPWLKFKGHLSNISENTLIGALNDETGEINEALDYDGGAPDTIPEMAKRWKAQGKPWLVVADENYGEGSAREHASLQIRHLNGKIVVARSFARIHRTNLHKQGIVGLVFKNPEDYSLISSGDSVDTDGLDAVLSGDLAHPIHLVVHKPDGDVKRIPVEHALSKDQLAWIVYGSALNMIRDAA